MKDLMILLEVHTTLHLKSFIGLTVWKQIYGASALSPTSYYVEADPSGHGQNLEFSVQS